MMVRQHDTARRTTFGLLGAALLVSACTQNPAAAPGTGTPVPGQTVLSSESPTPGKSPAPTASSSPTPNPSPSPLRYTNDFEALAVGTTPSDFVDVTTEETTPSWVYKGNWAISADERGNKVFLHDDVRQQPAVSFQRYKGTALGKPNGQMPDTYYAEVAVRPLKSPYNYSPTGDQGVQFFYVKYDTYVEVVIKPTYIEIWEANAAEPKTTKGWKRLWGQSLTTNAGDVRRVGALVDMKAGTFTAYLDGQPLDSVHSDIITQRTAYVALRGIGNVVSFDNLLIEAR